MAKWGKLACSDDLRARVAELEAESARLRQEADLQAAEIDKTRRRADKWQSMVLDCEKYLKPGETPRERMDRDHNDTLSLMSSLAKEKRKTERLRQEITEHPNWEGFGRDILESWPVHNIDGAELFDAALRNGLIQEVPGGYDPEQHIDADGICPEKGDPWYEYAFPYHANAHAALDTMLAQAREEGAEAMQEAAKTNLRVYAPQNVDGPEHDVGYYSGYHTALDRIRAIDPAEVIKQEQET